jgi:hypothetical protein
LFPKAASYQLNANGGEPTGGTSSSRCMVSIPHFIHHYHPTFLSSYSTTLAPSANR